MSDLDNRVVANFKQMAVNLEAIGENPYRIRAYRKVIYIVGELLQNGDSLSNHLENLREISGIGEKSAAKILYLVDHTNLEGLTIENLVEEVPVEKEDSNRIPLEEATKIANPVVMALIYNFSFSRIEYVGSVRREKKTVHDIDIIAEGDTKEIRQGLIDLFATQLDKIETKGVEKCKGYKQNLLMEIRVVDPDRYAATLIHCTGSRDYNVEMRKVLKMRGQHFSENGFWTNEDPTDVKRFKTEEEYFDIMGLRYLPPKDREVKNMEWIYESALMF